jgi:hypothetical protein
MSIAAPVMRKNVAAYWMEASWARIGCADSHRLTPGSIKRPTRASKRAMSWACASAAFFVPGAR